MPDSPEKPKPVDLSTFQMMPDWVTNLGSPPAKEYEKFEEPQREGRWEKRERGPGRPRVGGGGQDRRGPGGGGPDRRGPGGGMREGGRREGGDSRRPREGGRGDSGGSRGDFRRQPPRLVVPEGLEVEVSATGPCLDALVGRIKMSGRAFGMFDLAKVVLEARDRIEVEFIRRDPEKAPRLFLSGEGEEAGLWVDRVEAARKVLRKESLEKLYRVEETEVEPPKGDFKAVAVCGMSGQLLGPPNHHSFQTAVLRLHRERFSRMPLAEYKARIRTETDEELVNRWKEQQSKQIHYIYPREPVEGVPEVVLDSLDAVERHFLSELCEEVVREVDRAIVPGQIPGKQISPDLLALLRHEVDGLQRNPFHLVKRLCGQLERRGLKIFKRQGKKLFVSKARPRGLDPQVSLSDDVSAIIHEIRTRPGIKVSELVTFLAPRSSDHRELKPGELTPGETAILTHLRWLIDEGFVIEYASTALFLGVQASEGGRGKTEPEEGEGEGHSEDASGGEPVVTPEAGEEAAAEALVPEEFADPEMPFEAGEEVAAERSSDPEGDRGDAAQETRLEEEAPAEQTAAEECRAAAEEAAFVADSRQAEMNAEMDPGALNQELAEGDAETAREEIQAPA